MRKLIEHLGLYWLVALIGRVAYRAHARRKDKRLFWSWDLLWEVPIAAFCGTAAGGIASWLQLGTMQTLGLVSVLAYLGPGAIEAYAARFMDHWSRRKD